MRYDLYLTPLFAGALILGGLGCGQKKIEECNSLIQVINTNVASMKKGLTGQDVDGGVKELNAMADAMDKIADDAAKVELSTPELKKFGADYQAMARNIAKAERDMASAAAAKDSAKLMAAQTQLDQFSKQEEPLVAAINKFCQAP